MAESYEFNAVQGYCAIGIYGAKFGSNVGSLWRSATNLNANYIFTIGARYQKQRTDTLKAFNHIPLFEYESFDDFKIPRNSQLICAEIDDKSKSLVDFVHPERAIYLLGSEDSGLPKEILDFSNEIIEIPSKYCLNVAMVGSIILYDRLSKGTTYEKK